MFVLDARVGDLILIESGVAISKVEAEHPQEM
jgi:hydrogenase maturation factor